MLGEGTVCVCVGKYISGVQKFALRTVFLGLTAIWKESERGMGEGRAKNGEKSAKRVRNFE